MGYLERRLCSTFVNKMAPGNLSVNVTETVTAKDVRARRDHGIN
jgi:hypothetical protein